MLIKPVIEKFAKIKVVGVGGGGGNAINSMISSGSILGVDFMAINTDKQDLNANKADEVLQIGENVTNGLGSGAVPEIGKQSAEESKEEIKKHLQGYDMVFITAGMGGGTGTGASPIVASIAKELGALTVAVVTKPFDFEGVTRRQNAERGIRELKEQVDALITIPNQKLLDLEEKNLPIQDAFALADSILSQGVKGISDLIVQPGLINVDFADVKTIMQNAGTALMGIGRADGESRAEVAAEQAINSPLLDINIKGATGILLNIVGPDLTLAEVETISTKVAQEAGEGAHIIIGANPSKGDKSKTLSVTVIATGFDSPYSSDYDLGDFNFTPTPLKKASPSETPSSKPSFEKDSSSLETVTDPDAEEPLESPEDSSDDKKGDDDPWKLPTFLRRG